jgi:hypothetical protein
VGPPGLLKGAIKDPGLFMTPTELANGDEYCSKGSTPGSLHEADSFQTHNDSSSSIPIAESVLRLNLRSLLELGKNECLVQCTRLVSVPHTYPSVFRLLRWKNALKRKEEREGGREKKL